MGRRRWARGARAVALIASLAVLLTGCSAHDLEKHLRFGWPTGVTRQATEVRVLWTWAGVAALVVGVLVWGLIFWVCIRYRKKSDELPKQTKYNLPLEIGYSIAPFLIIAALFYRTVVVEDNVNHLSKNPDVNIQVDAFKWNWQFEYQQYTDAAGTKHLMQYPGTRDVTSDTPNKLLNVSTVGSTTEIPVLVIPVNRSVQVDEHSYDVIHSFWVPEFLFKRDVIPYGSGDTSRDNKFEFTAISTGSFVGRCAELCGTYHSQMNFEVRVVSMQTFVTYVNDLRAIGPDDPARQSKALLQAHVPGGAYATTTYPFTTDRSDLGPSQRQGG